MPIPISDPAIGDGLAMALGALYKAGGSERPWTTGAGGLYTDSGSWSVVLFQKAYIGVDRFRVLGKTGHGGLFGKSQCPSTLVSTLCVGTHGRDAPSL